MSAVTPIDKRRGGWIIRFVPQADSCSAANRIIIPLPNQRG
jgi:hypothetical protein